MCANFTQYDEYKDLDDKWIQNFENTENQYYHFYKENIFYIHLNFIYVNRENEIIKIKNEPFILSNPNTILAEEWIGIFNKHSILNGEKYKLHSVLKYNICIDTDEVSGFLKENDTKDYLTIIKNIGDIYFDATIHMFHDLNDLTIILKQRENTLEMKNYNNITKKHFYHSNSKHNKTKRK